MQKKGDFDITVFQWTFSIILAVAVVAALLVFIENSATGVTFKKNVLARDVALLIDTLYLSPGNTLASYPIESTDYAFTIGRQPEGFRVKVKTGKEEKSFANTYSYAEDTNFESIDYKMQGNNAINGLMLAKTNEGISVLEMSPDSSMPKIKKKEITSSIPIVKHFAGEETYAEKDLIEQAKKNAASLNAIWPVKLEEVVTSCYGDRKSLPRTLTECSKDHCGMDIRAVGKDGKMSDVLAIAGGIVENVGEKYGTVTIDHGSISVKYIHLSKSHVAAGNIIEQGDVIGKAGSKGLEASTDSAAHLHISTLVNGVYFDPLEIGVFDVEKISFKKGSNCFENAYSYTGKINERSTN